MGNEGTVSVTASGQKIDLLYEMLITQKKAGESTTVVLLRDGAEVPRHGSRTATVIPHPEAH